MRVTFRKFSATYIPYKRAKVSKVYFFGRGPGYFSFRTFPDLFRVCFMKDDPEDSRFSQRKLNNLPR